MGWISGRRSAIPEEGWASPRGCQTSTSWQLSSGRSVKLDGFYSGLTYAGLLEGRASARLNTEIVERLRSRAREMLGEEPFPITTEVVVGAEGGEWLPPLWYAARLTSGPLGEEGSGSVMVVVGFSPPFFNEPLGDFLASRLGNLPWERESRDVLH